MQTILSIYPGIDILGRAFAAAGYSVVLGPDLIWDSQVEHFHAEPGIYTGIVSGPPCQNYSDANRRRDTQEGDRTLRELLRIIDEAQPLWFLVENVRNVPDIIIAPYRVQRLDITDAACGGKQRRLRHIQFGHLLAWIIRPARTNSRRPVTPAVTTSNDNPHDRPCRRNQRMGLDQNHAPALTLRSLTPSARARAIGNGVPWAVATTLANAVASAGPVTPNDCACNCGRPITPPAKTATAACRKRLSRRRHSPTRVVTLIDTAETADNLIDRSASEKEAMPSDLRLNAKQRLIQMARANLAQAAAVANEHGDKATANRCNALLEQTADLIGAPQTTPAALKAPPVLQPAQTRPPVPRITQPATPSPQPNPAPQGGATKPTAPKAAQPAAAKPKPAAPAPPPTTEPLTASDESQAT